MYPNITSECQIDVPPSLTRFTNTVIQSRNDFNAQKRIAIEHAIISAIRPRSFLSPGVGVYICRKIGSKDLIKTLTHLGFCSSYKEVQNFELNALKVQRSICSVSSGFTQFVFDNADFNTKTID